MDKKSRFHLKARSHKLVVLNFNCLCSIILLMAKEITRELKRKTLEGFGKKSAVLTLGAAAFVLLYFIPQVFASTNINSVSPNFYAWNDVIGWINFYITGNVNVTSNQLAGYATSSVGYIALDCATSPNGNICGSPPWMVSNDGNGNLAGWGYNDSIGWISFCGNGSASSTWNGSAWVCPSNPTYQVFINSASGDFSGWAWNDTVGWISFCGYSGAPPVSNCANSLLYSYKVNTTWINNPLIGYLISSTYDSFATSAVNTIMWNGSLNGGSVRFQIASSNTLSGLSDSSTYLGPDGTSNTYYTPDPGVPVSINLNNHNNQRYFRYKLWLYSDGAKTQSPVVNSVIINYSP